MFKFRTIVSSLCALMLSTVALGQVQFIDVDPGNEGIALWRSYYNPSTNHLLVPGDNYYGGGPTTSSWLYDIDLGAGTWNRSLIPGAINGGDVFARGISRDGANVFGWMDSPGSDPSYEGEGFFAPVGDVGNRSLIGFISPGVAESRAWDMSANGTIVGDATGGSQGFYWTQGSGIQSLPRNGGGSLARSISTDGTTIGGMYADQGLGSEGAGTWHLSGNQWVPSALNPIEDPSLVLAGSSDGFYFGGDRNFIASAWINGNYNEILLDGLPLNGEVRAVTDDGFFVGVGLFGNDTRGFVWHEGWAEAMTARDYVLWSQGIDIGHDIMELNGASSYGGNLFLTGYGSGAVLQTPAYVPEPGTASFLLAGAGLSVVLLRRRSILALA